jgi:hypothetical protein
MLMIPRQGSKAVSALRFYNDRQKVAELDKDLRGKLSSLNLISNDKNPRVSFCGLLVREAELSIFLPRSVDHQSMSDPAKHLAASELMRAVGLYGQASKTAVNLSDVGESLEGQSQLGVVTQLIKSYRARGLYARRRATKTLNAGKPDWNATVANSAAFPDSAGRPIYLDIVSSKRRYFSDCEVARIQAMVLREIDEKFSWIVTGKQGLFAPELKDVALPRGGREYMLAMLRRELPLLYSDNDVRLVTSLINYLQEVSGEQESGMIIGLRQFHFAWEFMLSRVLTDVWVGINKILPAPTYKKSDGSFSNAFRSGMKTDTALKRSDGSRVVIVDAKYYEATNVSNAPGWADIVKQFFYEKALSAAGVTSDIRNVFVFPGTEGPFTAVHLRSKKDEQFFDEDFPPVYCYYLNPLDVIHHYINNKKMHGFSQKIFGDAGPVLQSVV